MNTKFKYLLYSCIIIAVIDALGALASRQFQFQYGYLMPVSIGAYVALALFENKAGGLKAAVIYTALLALFDATAGWRISQALNANTDSLNNYPKPAVWALTAVLVTLYGAFVGWVTAGVYNLLRKNKQER